MKRAAEPEHSFGLWLVFPYAGRSRAAELRKAVRAPSCTGNQTNSNERRRGPTGFEFYRISAKAWNLVDSWPVSPCE